MRTIAAALLVFPLLGPPAFAQSGVYSRATPPDQTTLDRLNLTTEWSAYVPVQGRQDGLARVQVVDENQVFVQTRTGLLVALDGKSGREQWKYKFPAAYSDGFAVAANSKYVFAVNVSKLFCFQRYTGAVEFEVNLPETPATGPVSDGDNLYLAFTGAKVVCYDLPPPFRTTMRATQEMKEMGIKPKNPAEGVAGRNGGRTFTSVRADEEIERYNVPKAYLDADARLSTSQTSPSISALPTVVPPYTLGGLNKVVSISTLPSLRRPYTLRPEYMAHNQLTPSISAIPPSLARVYELSNLRPPPFEPKQLWANPTTAKVYQPPLFVPDSARASARLWVTEDSARVQAMHRNMEEGKPQVWTLPARPAAQLVGPFGYAKESLLGVLPLADGQVLGIDLTAGTIEDPRYEWRANVGGLLNRTPIAAADGVYVGGDNSGSARINVTTGEVDWRTPSEVDRIVAVSDAHVFARDRRGNLLLYAKGRVSDAASLIAKPIASMSVADFGVTVTNPVTDRVLLAAENGLVVSVRDAGPKFAKAKLVSPPPPPFNPDAKPADPAKPGDPAAVPMEPRKDEPKK